MTPSARHRATPVPLAISPLLHLRRHRAAHRGARLRVPKLQDRREGIALPSKQQRQAVGVGVMLQRVSPARLRDPLALLGMGQVVTGQLRRVPGILVPGAMNAVPAKLSMPSTWRPR